VLFRTASGSRPEIISVQLDQVEGVEEPARVVPPVAYQVEARHAVVAAADRLAVDACSRPAHSPHTGDRHCGPPRAIKASARWRRSHDPQRAWPVDGGLPSGLRVTIGLALAGVLQQIRATRAPVAIVTR
jgi:hypothetical protein